MEEFIKALMKTGLTKAESKVYFYLVGVSQSTSGDVIKNTGLQSSTVYHVVNTLIDKGLVSYTLKNNIKYFQVTGLSNLINYLDGLKEEIKSSKKKLNRLFAEIKKSEKKEIYEVKVFEGWNGVWNAFEECLEKTNKKEPILIYTLSKYVGADPNMAKALINRIRNKRLKRKLYEKIIINESERKTLGRDHEKLPYTQIKYLPENLSNPAIVHIYSDRVLIVISSKKPIATMIKDRFVVESFRNNFKLLWKIAK
ncbi:MAG: hypothetical protein IB618_01670 [Candidatus Pacearchaeota archaeon]|nr:MAG: hypothetical protein IB618_01670 [Candidatus Pacearchaeota archaeon]